MREPVCGQLCSHCMARVDLPATPIENYKLFVSLTPIRRRRDHRDKTGLNPLRLSKSDYHSLSQRLLLALCRLSQQHPPTPPENHTTARRRDHSDLPNPLRFPFYESLIFSLTFACQTGSEAVMIAIFMAGCC